jgi:AraC family transcriptional regulator
MLPTACLALPVTKSRDPTRGERSRKLADTISEDQMASPHLEREFARGRMFRFRINPGARDLPHCSALLHGVGRSYRVERYRTTLSVKSVIRGAAYYTTPQGRYLVTEGSFLVLNCGQEYDLEFDGRGTTETLCPFFQPGFLEHVAHSLASPLGRQLDQIEADAPATDFCERLYPIQGPVASAFHRLRHGLATPEASDVWLEDQLYALAAGLVGVRAQVRHEIDRFPGGRRTTREELYRRLHRGRDFLASCYDQPVTVSEGAAAACLSPFHFHRMFKAAFGTTPMQFLQEHRLAVARRLLSTTDEPVTAICFAVGFESLGTFSWLFRKRFGLSPRQFRGKITGRTSPQD